MTRINRDLAALRDLLDLTGSQAAPDELDVSMLRPTLDLGVLLPLVRGKPAWSYSAVLSTAAGENLGQLLANPADSGVLLLVETLWYSYNVTASRNVLLRQMDGAEATGTEGSKGWRDRRVAGSPKGTPRRGAGLGGGAIAMTTVFRSDRTPSSGDAIDKSPALADLGVVLPPGTGLIAYSQTATAAADESFIASWTWREYSE